MAAYFPRGKKSFADVKKKFSDDLSAATLDSSTGFAFVTNQELSISERQELSGHVSSACEIYHLERIVSILDQPSMAPVRLQFLGIPFLTDEISSPQAVFVRTVTRDSGMGDHFLGRKNDLALLAEFLKHSASEDGAPHIGVITGMPGVGKTSLAVEAAASVQRDGLYAGGVFLVDFKGYEGNQELPLEASQVLSGLLLAMGAGKSDPDAASNYLSYSEILTANERENRRFLFLFDNVADVNQVRDLLPAHGFHHVLITSRNSIGPRIQNSFGFPLSTISEDQSVKFLLQIDETRFSGQDQGLYALAEMCGGLPIALQLVSHVLVSDPDMSALEFAQELEEETSRLSGLEFEDAKIRSVFYGSYSRLAGEEAKCFRYLTTHPGHELSVNATAHLLGITPVGARQGLRRLESSNLIIRDRSQGTWRIHDLLRLYGSELSGMLDDPNERFSALQRLFSYYFETVEQVNWWINGTGDGQGPEDFGNTKNALKWASREYVNVVACVGSASNMGDLDVSWDLAIAIKPYLDARGDFLTAIRVSESALASARSLEDAEKEADALNNLGLSYNSLHMYSDGKPLFLQARRIFRKIGVKEGEARVLSGLAESMRAEGHHEATIPVLRRAISLYSEIKNAAGLGYALTNMGISLRESGQYLEAMECLEKALVVHRATNSRRAEASTIAQLGTAIGQAGQVQDAIKYLEAAIELGKELGIPLLVGMAHMNKGNMFRLLEDAPNAEKEYLKAIRIFDETESESEKKIAVENLSRLRKRFG
jgi:tetratricopeptide (TPR) repeat protein